MKRIIRKMSMSLILLLTSSMVFSQDLDPVSVTKDYTRGWYIGAQAGMPMAVADFSSFAADKFRPGWSAGVHAGYRFTRVWSLEMTANWGQQFLAEQQCCFERSYVLGSDHNRYREGYYVPAGMQCWLYKDLKSRTFVQRYGLQVNMNILGFFNSSKDGRWRLDISPAVYLAGTSSDLMTKADNTPVAENLNDWHLGYGGMAQLSYAVAKNMSLGVYGGFTHLTGNPMDGMPELHTTNNIYDAGVKLSFTFGKKKDKNEMINEEESEMANEESEEIVEGENEMTNIENDTIVEVESEIANEESEEIIEMENDTIIEADEESEEENIITSIEFPVIYFSFNSIWIEPSERAKVKEIADMMKADKSIRIKVTGWGDEIGSEEANQRVSLQRAEAVKRVLGQWLIPAERVETVGGGINRDAQSREEARQATTIEMK